MRQNDIQTENERERCGLGKQLKEAEHKPSNCVGGTEPGRQDSVAANSRTLVSAKAAMSQLHLLHIYM